MDATDTPETGPAEMTVDDLMAQFDSAIAAQPEADAADDEPADAPDEDEQSDDQDPDAADDGEPQHLTIEEYGELTIPVKVDGKEIAVNLKEAAAGYQRQADYTRKTQAIQAEREAMAADLAAKEAALAQRERLLTEQFAQFEEPEPDWRKLAEEDPLGWQLTKFDHDRKKAQRAELTQKAKAQAEAQAQAFMYETWQRAQQVRPDWTDPEKVRAGAEDRRAIASSFGFTQQEYELSNDFRIAALLQAVADARAATAKAEPAAKKLALAPKVLKPSASRGKADVQVDQSRAIDRRLSKPFDMNDINDLLRKI